MDNKKQQRVKEIPPKHLMGSGVTRTIDKSPCHRFLKQWLARHKNPSIVDWAMALLVQLLWESRAMPRHVGAIGFSSRGGERDSGGMEFPLGGIKALERLNQAGIIRLKRGVVGQVIYTKNKTTSIEPESNVTLIDLPWLNDGKDDC